MFWTFIFCVLDMQVRNDVIRYRYGDEQHLDEALKRIFQYGQVVSRLFFAVA